VLIAAFLTLSASLCLEAASMTDAERMCCAQMAGECGTSMASVHHCCRTDSESQQPVPAAAPVKVHKPSPIVIAFLYLTEAAPLEVAPSTTVGFSRGSPPTILHVPTYLALSTLRV
jgi:hypothetical protein